MKKSAIGLKIKQTRKAQRLTQVAMAKQLGISAAYLNLIEANKRAVGGKLLIRIALLLNLDANELSGALERRISDDLRELPSDPLLQQFALQPDSVEELVAQHPDWARATLALYRAYLDGNQTVAALSDRLSKDPILQQSVHQMLTHITSIRSTAEILDEEDDLKPQQLHRFHTTINRQSFALSEVAQKLISHFDEQHIGNKSLNVAEQVDDFIIGKRNYFPELELAAIELRQSLDNLERRNIDGALEEYLSGKHGLSVVSGLPDKQYEGIVRNQCVFNESANQLVVMNNARPTTRRFQLARIAAEKSFSDLLEHSINDPRLNSPEARQRARHSLSAYIAGATLMPYTKILQDAQNCRYDIEFLSRQYKAGFEQVCHRLVTLRKTDAEGIPFAFVRTDLSGYITKRFPLHGFPLPRYGHGCPLWVIYSAFQSPHRIARQFGEFPGGGKFLMLARSVTKQSPGYHDQDVRYSIMLACDQLHADQTIYVDGLDLFSTSAADSIGPGCRLCSRVGCQHRQESPAGGVLQDPALISGD